MSKASNIVKAARRKNTKAIENFTSTVDERVEQSVKAGIVGKEKYALATASGRKEAAVIAATLLREDQFKQNMLNDEKKLVEAVRRFNNKFRSKNGRSNHDMLEALLSFFCENHDDLLEQALVSALPVKVSLAQAKALISDPFVRDVIEGRGFAVPTASELPALIRSINPSTSHAGGRPRKVRLVSEFGQGHSRDYVSNALPAGRIPDSGGGAMSKG